ncbi:MAG: hypothetical protein EOL90_12665 [Spartobacteria bacterium]|nr:hypothetical protein [Spartobacteria bacterium]
MKKLVWGLVGVALAASVVAASAQEVLSANTIGYIKKELPGNNKIICLTIPLFSMTEGSNVFGRTSMAQEAPNGSWVYFWNPVSQTWVGGGKSSKGAWAGAQSNYVIKAGEAFFLKSTNATPTEITIAGEVPALASQTRAIAGASALGTVGNPYPADFKFGESDLAKNAANGSWVYFWNPVSQTWVGGGKSSKGLWAGAQSNYVVKATEGFFLKTSNATSWVWTNAKPYTWP